MEPRPSKAQLIVAGNDVEVARQVRALLAAYEVPCAVLAEPCDCEYAPRCRWLKDAPLGPTGQIQALLVDAIAVLERSRHAFKSRELGMLRKRLAQTLSELSEPHRLV
ncbi:MAG: hypothetical protein GAK43_01208 [Stenotrophomonas maltophilia]|nr:MAG: hypothetical protein GAK43_01208 [Stenotrophomonas maltophilia]